MFLSKTRSGTRVVTHPSSIPERKTKSITTKGVCPQVAEFFDLLAQSETTVTELERCVGLSRGTIFRWRNRSCAGLDNFAAALEGLGYQLTITCKDRDGN